MSADQCSICPRCSKRREREIHDSEARLKAAYGKFDLDRWMQMQAEHDELANKVMHETFREDFEVNGVEDGEVEVEYRGSCSVCDLRAKFDHRHKVEGIED